MILHGWIQQLAVLFGERHDRPHLDDFGLCMCGCGECSVGDVCICQECNARRCGLHDGVRRSPRPTPLP